MLKTGPDYISSACAQVEHLVPLPADYYPLSNPSRFVIKKGDHNGVINIKPDSVKFLSDPAAIIPTYALGIKVTRADADSLLPDKSTAIIGVKFENMLFGNYRHGGITVIKDPANINVIDTLKYYTQIPVADIKVWTLKTISPNSVVTSGFSDVLSLP